MWPNIQMKANTKKSLKNEIIDMMLGLFVTAISYFVIRLTGAPVENLVYAVIFLLVLILLKLPNRK